MTGLGDLLRLLGGRASLGELLEVLAQRYGDRVAVEQDDRRWTYRELAARVADRAVQHRVHAGKTVLLVWPNDAELLVELLALSRAGAVVAPVKARTRPEELRVLAEVVGAHAAVAPPGVSVDVPLPGGETGADTALLLCTSGTTGRPKAARLTSRGLIGGLGWLASLPVGLTWGPRGHRDAVLAALPLAHVMGLATAVGALCAGVPWIHHPHFDADEVLDRFEARRPNVFVGVPTMYADLEAAGADDRDLSSVQLWLSGADAMPLDRARRFQARGAGLWVAGRPLGGAWFADTYGMVELSGPAAVRVLAPIPTPTPPFRARPGLSVRALDAEGRPLGYGRKGELAFRGPAVTRGYRGRAEVGDWLRSGDVGRVLPGGWFWVDGRDHDRLKVGGFSVFPAEVEALLDGAPGVREVAVVGAPDPRLGQRLVAVVVPAGGFEPEGFLAWCEPRLSGYRRPSAVVVCDALPRGPNGKLDRASATELARRISG